MSNEKEIRLEFNPHLYRHNVLYGNHDWEMLSLFILSNLQKIKILE